MALSCCPGGVEGHAGCFKGPFTCLIEGRAHCFLLESDSVIPRASRNRLENSRVCDLYFRQDPRQGSRGAVSPPELRYTLQSIIDTTALGDKRLCKPQANLYDARPRRREEARKWRAAGRVSPCVRLRVHFILGSLTESWGWPDRQDVLLAMADRRN